MIPFLQFCLIIERNPSNPEKNLFTIPGKTFSSYCVLLPVKHEIQNGQNNMTQSNATLPINKSLSP